MPGDKPIACSLSKEELTDRLAEIRALGQNALIRKGADGALLFRRDPETRARLEAIVAAESRCCSFLAFDLRDETDGLVLRIDASDNGWTAARDLADAFTAAQEPA